MRRAAAEHPLSAGGSSLPPASHTTRGAQQTLELLCENTFWHGSATDGKIYLGPLLGTHVPASSLSLTLLVGIWN